MPQFKRGTRRENPHSVALVVKCAQLRKELHAAVLHFFQLLEATPEEDALSVLSITRHMLKPAAQCSICIVSNNLIIGQKQSIRTVDLDALGLFNAHIVDGGNRNPALQGLNGQRDFNLRLEQDPHGVRCDEHVVAVDVRAPEMSPRSPYAAPVRQGDAENVFDALRIDADDPGNGAAGAVNLIANRHVAHGSVTRGSYYKFI